MADASSATGLRASNVIAHRITADSVVTRDGARRWLGDLVPAVLGYAASPQGPRPDTVTEVRGERIEWIRIFSHRYTRFGPPRMVPHTWLARVGEVQGASVFVERGLDVRSDPEVVYLLTPDCLFQPYISPEGSR
ncbi:MAG TPA: hypothetical protein VHG28_04515 [Longimicrobiaceae bacterium]|nr:hypothetical protein [Longimicrobiaceae bacterium]